MVFLMANKQQLAHEASVFSSIIDSEFSELRALTQEAQLEMDTEFATLWDDLTPDLTELQVEAICLLETKRQEKALDALLVQYFSSSN